MTGTASGESTSVTWSVLEAGGGSISSAGVYQAPGAAGTYTVIATSVADPDASRQASVIVTAAPATTFADQLHAISGKRIYYQHASLGGESVGVYQAPGPWPDPYWGLDEMCRAHPTAGTTLARNQGYPTAPPRTVAVGTVSEWTHGALNGNAPEKLRQFDLAIRAFTVPVDVAILKLGLPDFDQQGYVVGTGMTEAQWFTSVYQPALAALERDFPDTIFVHGTLHIMMASNYWGNAARESWNNRLRTTYPGRVWDLAYWLSVNRAGNRCIGADGAPCMHADWQIPTDGHCNQPGADWLGENLLAFLSTVN
ncbi:MAG: hypothetical protein QM767_18055 [Anaeromyxobacter sp.]